MGGKGKHEFFRLKTHHYHHSLYYPPELHRNMLCGMAGEGGTQVAPPTVSSGVNEQRRQKAKDK
jgi:hypothetical protein